MSRQTTTVAGADAVDTAAPRRDTLRRRCWALIERDVDSSTASVAIDVVLVTLICLSVAGIVLESVESLYTNYRGVFDGLERLTVAVFTVEYLLRLWTAVEHPRVSAWPGGGLVQRLRYAATPVALIDLVAIAPFYIAAAGLIPASDLRFLRALRLMRIFKLTRYSAAFETLGNVFRENARAFAAAFFVLIIVMLVAATGMYLFEREAQPEAFSSIPAAMWWAFATLTTVGYGDITPITPAGKVFGALISVVGIAMVALPTGILASAFSEQLRRRTEAYRIESDKALRDGVIDEEELDSLEALREKLGLSTAAATDIMDRERARIEATGVHRTLECCPHCGAPSRG
jgi:voltage-gated potassium channel